jgi:hypothetical protein
MYGFEAKQLLIEFKHHICLEIKAKLELIVRSNNHLPRLLEEIFEGEEYNVMDMFLRKGIPNQAVGKCGKCGKQRNKKIISTLFKNIDDANMFRDNHHGTKLELFDGCFTVNKTYQLEIEDGFRPIREMVLSMARLDVMRVYTALDASGDFRVVALKTDAVFYYKLRPDAELPAPIQALMGEKLGGVRVEHKHPGCSPIQYMKMGDPDMPILLSMKSTPETKIENEYDPEEIKAKIKSRTILMCPPGCGKSHAALLRMPCQLLVWTKCSW